MHAKIRDYTPADLESLRALISAPGMAAQFDKYQGEHGAERMLGDPYLHPGAVKMVFEDDEAAGFAITYLLPHGDASFAMNRIGVRESSRRKGLATALLAVAEHWALTQSHAPVAELAASAWAPEPAADALAARHGYVHDRWFWLMERPRGTAPEPRWPDGVTMRSWDGSVTMLDDAVAAYNHSFAEHYHFVRGSRDSLERIMTRGGAAPGQLCVAYRGGVAAGFCRCERFGPRGEIAVLGTTRAARGLGLGRALLHWGVRWLEANTATPVTLLVDGENENALTLYKSEGFAVTRTRRVWVKRVTRP